MSATQNKKVIPIAKGWEAIMQFDNVPERPPGGKTMAEITEDRMVAGKTYGSNQVKQIVSHFVKQGKLKPVKSLRVNAVGKTVQCIYYVPVS